MSGTLYSVRYLIAKWMLDGRAMVRRSSDTYEKLGDGTLLQEDATIYSVYEDHATGVTLNGCASELALAIKDDSLFRQCEIYLKALREISESRYDNKGLILDDANEAELRQHWSKQLEAILDLAANAIVAGAKVGKK